MENYHETSSLVSESDIRRLEAALERSWSKETCYPRDQHAWTEENKALGQCAVTTMVVYDLYGGKLAYDRDNDHFWNIFPDDSHHDFTRTQFSEGTVFHETVIAEGKDFFRGEGAITSRTWERYELLKENVEHALSIDK